MSVQEQELYQKEGLGVNEVRYVDNQDCIGKCVSLPSSTLFIFKVCNLKKKEMSSLKFPTSLQKCHCREKIHCILQIKKKNIKKYKAGSPSKADKMSD